MTETNYREYWQQSGKVLYKYEFNDSSVVSISEATKTSLERMGLPLSAAPFLSFQPIRDGSLLTPNEYFRLNFEELNDFLVIGTEGSGSPICIDTLENDMIVWLDHEDGFQPVYINSNLTQFAFCVTRYAKFIDSIVELSAGKYSRRKFSQAEFDDLKNDFLKIDPLSLNKQSFWDLYLENLWHED